ncbi:polysaccharide export protein [Oceanimonas pelagia]|uniref:Polysaccharide export protein n=1 Tax=Oceanimonas pelagia TaxID=3028314 RepID=A0AA50KMJ1_9GAMM|nr:polysaccharide biosynthesis/export family protein [Oceanimonas pelagia]WMC09831.1 polysaccharide export protein [Oceanimonas pelagia]
MLKPLDFLPLLTLLGACTPLHQVHINQQPPAAIEAGREHPLGPGRSTPIAAAQSLPLTPLPRWAAAPPLSPGDRLQIEVVDGEDFSGRFEVNTNGTLTLPFLPPLAVAGGSLQDAEKQIAEALVAERFFRPQRVEVSLRLHEWGHAQVHVSGAVFNPGMVTVNARGVEERALKDRLSTGDFASERLLATALRAAGGVRPDADLSRIRLTRGEQTLVLDYRPLLQGRAVRQVALMSGDVIEVPESGRFQRDLMTLSPITPPGIRVFLSNLTVPATGNAISAVGRDASSLPYGARLLTAGTSANCLGGTRLTNADRYLVLVRTDPLTGQPQTLERSVQELLAAPQRDDLNPYLMPNDAVSCYDSGVTNLRDLARTLTELLLPLSLL